MEIEGEKRVNMECVESELIVLSWNNFKLYWPRVMSAYYSLK